MVRRTAPSKNSVVDAIFVSDMHLTDRQPSARIDNYLQAQETKLQFLQELSATHSQCPIICAGDVFDRWRVSPFLCNFAYQNLPRPFICIPGQHDLPLHSIRQYSKSPLALLENIGKENGDIVVLHANMTVHPNPSLCIFGLPFGAEIDTSLLFPPSSNIRRILVMHKLVWQSRPFWDTNAQHTTADEVLNQYGGLFDVILTGDNHIAFTKKQANTLLVNPGSMLRTTIDQQQHIPCCYLYSARTNTVQRVPLPTAPDVWNPAATNEHVSKEDAQIAAYINKLSADSEQQLGLSFKRNLETYFVTHKTPKRIQEIIWAHLDDL